jgi:hypothetical protein
MIDTTEEIFQALRQLVHDDPALQARLFALDKPDDFIAAVQQLALSMGCTLPDGEVLRAMSAGQRGWIERSLP